MPMHTDYYRQEQNIAVSITARHAEDSAWVNQLDVSLADDPPPVLAMSQEVSLQCKSCGNIHTDTHTCTDDVHKKKGAS
eukprot:4827875-Amphidinium_carterae.1